MDIRIPHARGQRMRALHAQLRSAIVDGRLAGGTPLPSTRALASSHGLARNTVIAAYELLMAEGYLLPRVGATPVVAQLPRKTARNGVASYRKQDDVRLHAMWRAPDLRPTALAGLPVRSFRLGMPEHRGFPHEVWRRLSMRVLRDWSRTPFRYPPAQGLPELREAIARHVAFARAVSCGADDVVVTSGAQQAFDLLARLLVTPGKTRVAVEEPGYPPLRAAFAAAGARLVPIPVDAQGLCVDALPDDVAVVCVTPSHQSPTGAVMSLARRRSLLEFVQRRNASVIEDDYDGEFRFGGRPLDALQTLNAEGRVFYVGTFSKSLFPALRKGFVVAPGWAREPLVALKHCADGHSDMLGQAVLAAFIEKGHMARHARRMGRVYAQRHATLRACMEHQLAPWLQLLPSEAGLHLAARIRDPRSATNVIAAVRQHLPGAMSFADYAMTRSVEPGVVIGFGVIDNEAIEMHCRALAGALAS
ncbi:MAG: PLP-dependent aminotransferase family protein [Thermomonas sp.]